MLEKAIAPFIFTAMVVTAAGFYIYVQTIRPDTKVFNGTYTNQCCADVILKSGVIRHGPGRSVYQIYNMKFGLTAYVTGILTEDGLQKSDEKATLLFSKDERHLSFITTVNNRQYLFIRRAP